MDAMASDVDGQSFDAPLGPPNFCVEDMFPGTTLSGWNAASSSSSASVRADSELVFSFLGAGEASITSATTHDLRSQAVQALIGMRPVAGTTSSLVIPDPNNNSLFEIQVSQGNMASYRVGGAEVHTSTLNGNFLQIRFESSGVAFGTSATPDGFEEYTHELQSPPVAAVRVRLAARAAAVTTDVTYSMIRLSCP